MNRKALMFLLSMLCLLPPWGAAAGEAEPAGGAARVAATGEVHATLEAAISAAGDGGTVELLADVTLTKTLMITKPVEIASPGARTISRGFGGSAPMVLVQGGGSLSLSAPGGNLTLDGRNYAGSRNSVVSIGGDGALRLSQGVTLTGGRTTYGGGVYVKSGTVDMTGGEIRGNQARNGGGIFSESGMVTVSGGGIRGNQATFDGGGICSERGSVLISGGAVEDNVAGRSGGGVCNRMRLALSGGRIASNTGKSGGGVYTSADFQMTGGEISDNASQTGGGVWNAGNGAFHLDGGLIRRNASTGSGGGVSNQGSCRVSGGAISENTASGAGGGVHNQGRLALLGGLIEGNRARTGGGVQQEGDLSVGDCRFAANTGAAGGGIYATANSGSTLLDDANPFVDSPLYFEKAPSINRKVALTFTGSAPGAVAVQRGEWVSGDWFELTGMPGCELGRVPYEDSYALRVFQATETAVTMGDLRYGEAPAPKVSVRAGGAEVADPAVSLGYAAQPEGPFSGDAPSDTGAYWVRARFEGDSGAFLNPSEGVAPFRVLSAPPKVALADAQALYTGRPVAIGETRVTGVDGAPMDAPVAYEYYADPACTPDSRLDGPPSALGEYYVRASVAAQGDYAAGVSEPAKLTIGQLTGLDLTAPEGARAGGGYELLPSETLQLAPEFEPAWAVCPVRYASSDRRVAAVDGSGLVTATGMGEAVVTAAAEDPAGGGGFEASVTIRVLNGVASVSLPAEVQVFVNKSRKLTAAISPANAPDKALTWSVEPPSAGTISQDGTFTAGGAPAVATVTATANNGRKGSCALYVTAPAESVEIAAPDGAEKLPVNGTAQLAARVLPSTAYQKVSWKSDNRWVAPVDEGGLVRGRKPGRVVITATAQDGTKAVARFALEVVIPVASVSLPESAAVLTGGTVKLKASLTPERPTDRALSWSSDSACAAVSQDGVVTGVSKGVATITATAAGGASAACRVTVAPPVAAIHLSPVSGYSTAYAGETIKLNVQVLPEDAGDKALSWRSTVVRVARAQGDGEVTCQVPGRATITAQARDGGGASGSIELTVVAPAPSIGLNQTSAALYTNGEPRALQLAASPPSGTGFRALTWSVVSGQAASVDGQGLVKALADGEAVVRATTDRGAYAECAVLVRTLPSRLKFPKGNVALKPGDSVNLRELLSMDGSEPALAWASSDPSAVAVSPEGVAAGKKAGSATVTATAPNGLKASCTVTVSGEAP